MKRRPEYVRMTPRPISVRTSAFLIVLAAVVGVVRESFRIARMATWWPPRQ